MCRERGSAATLVRATARVARGVACAPQHCDTGGQDIQHQGGHTARPAPHGAGATACFNAGFSFYFTRQQLHSLRDDDEGGAQLMRPQPVQPAPLHTHSPHNHWNSVSFVTRPLAQHVDCGARLSRLKLSIAPYHHHVPPPAPPPPSRRHTVPMSSDIDRRRRSTLSSNDDTSSLSRRPAAGGDADDVGDVRPQVERSSSRASIASTTSASSAPPPYSHASGE